jgi:hypothetical protein
MRFEPTQNDNFISGQKLVCRRQFVIIPFRHGSLINRKLVTGNGNRKTVESFGPQNQNCPRRTTAPGNYIKATPSLILKYSRLRQ